MSFFTRLDHFSFRQVTLWLGICCILLLIFWLPALAYPTWADTAYYALLGKSIWTTGAYALDGVPHAKFLPLHAFYAYPFTVLFGYGIGMKVSTLVAGCSVILASYVLLKETVSRSTWLIVATLLLLQPGFILSTMLGSADLLFTALILTSAIFFVQADRQPTFYLWSGVLLGLACLTRYNGIPIFGIYGLYLLWKRPHDLRHIWSWAGGIVGIAILGLWFLRNFLVFGNALHTEYVTVQAGSSSSIVTQIINNSFYYADPLHSVLPVLFLLALWGVRRSGSKQTFLIFFALGATALALIWWSHGVRYMVPILPILLGFSVIGFIDLLERVNHKNLMIISMTALIVLTHVPVLCAYSYGSCNAWMDNHIGILPPFLGVSPEGMTSWNEAKNYVNAQVPNDSMVATGLDDVEIAVLESTFRPDLQIITRSNAQCPYYDLTQMREFSGSVLFTSENEPTARVTVVECK